MRSNLLAMKITIFLLTMFAFLIFQFYSGSITSSILRTKSDSIKTLADLVDSPLQLAVEDIIYNKDFFNVRMCVRSFESSLSRFGNFQTLFDSQKSIMNTRLNISSSSFLGMSAVHWKTLFICLKLLRKKNQF